MSDRVAPPLHARHLVPAPVQALSESSGGAFPVAFDQKQLHDASLSTRVPAAASENFRADGSVLTFI